MTTPKSIGIGWEPLEAKLPPEVREAMEKAAQALESATQTVEAVEGDLSTAKAQLAALIRTLPQDQIESSTGPEVYRAILDLLT